MTTQQKVVEFLKEIGIPKTCELFQVSKQVARVWVNSGNVPLAKIDRIFEEMNNLAEQKGQDLAIPVEATYEEEAKPVTVPTPVGMTGRKVEGTEEKKSAPPKDALPLTPAVPIVQNASTTEARFDDIFGRLEKLEDFARRMTDPDVLRNPSFTRPDLNANKKNSIMAPLPRPADNKVMTEQEHETAMSEIRLPGHDNWLEPHKKPYSKQ